MFLINLGLQGITTTEGIIKLTKDPSTIYITKAEGDNGAVKVLVIDSVDHVRVYAATVDTAAKPTKVTMGEMDKTLSGYCRDSEIPTAANKEIPTDKSFVTQSVLCASGNVVGDTTVCSDTIEPALKNIILTLEYSTEGDGNTITNAKFGNTDSGYTGSIFTAESADDTTLINGVLNGYSSVCESKKRVPRGSYLKATKTGDTETVYISDTNYIKTTTAGVTLVYPVTTKEYLETGSKYTIGAIDSTNSGTCTNNAWNECTSATTAPCSGDGIAAITIIKETADTFSGMTDYTIAASTDVEFNKILTHNNCLMKNIKLTKTGISTIYITKPDGSNNVNVLVVDSVDHVRVYSGTSSLANDNKQTITVGDMDNTHSGYCRDSDIPTAADKQIPTTNSFVSQSILCPGSDNIGAESVCTDTNSILINLYDYIEPGNIEITYTADNDASTTSIKVGSDTAGYTLSDATGDTTITSIMGDYSTVCNTNLLTNKRIPRGSYLKATKTGDTETVYIYDTNYIKTTTAGVTLVYPVTKKEYLETGSKYTIGEIDLGKSGKCENGKFTTCTAAGTAPCDDVKPTSPTITLEKGVYSGMTDYTIESSSAEIFNGILSHSECKKEITLTAVKLTKTDSSTIYVTKPAEGSTAVNVLVVDSVDHVRVYSGTSSVTNDKQTITVGEMDNTHSGYCRDSDIPTAADKQIPTTNSFISQSILCKTGDVISTTEVCTDTITPALKSKTIEITYTADSISTVKVDTADYSGVVTVTADDTTISNILNDYSTVCNTNSQTKKRIPRGSYLKATKTGGEAVYISDTNYIKTTTTDGITLVYKITKEYLDVGSQYTIGEIELSKSGKCENGKFTPCSSATAAPCDATKPTSPTITLEKGVYSGMTDYTIESSNKADFDGILSHTGCVPTPEETKEVPPNTIMTYTINTDIKVYISDNIAVKEKGDEFLVYTVDKKPETTNNPTGSKYVFTYKPELSGKCKDNALSKCDTTSPSELCSSTDCI